MDVDQFKKAWTNSKYIPDIGYAIVFLEGESEIYPDQYAIGSGNKIFFSRDHMIVASVKVDKILSVL